MSDPAVPSDLIARFGLQWTTGREAWNFVLTRPDGLDFCFTVPKDVLEWWLHEGQWIPLTFLSI